MKASRSQRKSKLGEGGELILRKELKNGKRKAN
jgi:hypothetical protein